MISKENYIRQALDAVAAQAGLEWDAQAATRESEVAAWRADAASIQASWEAEVEATKDGEEPPAKPDIPPRPQHATRIEAMSAAMEADRTDHEGAWVALGYAKPPRTTAAIRSAPTLAALRTAIADYLEGK